MTVKENEFIETTYEQEDKEVHHLTRYYLFSPFLRIFHWLMVLSIIILFATGIVIMTPMSMGEGQYVILNEWHLSVDWLRNLHFLAGTRNHGRNHAGRRKPLRNPTGYAVQSQRPRLLFLAKRWRYRV